MTNNRPNSSSEHRIILSTNDPEETKSPLHRLTLPDNDLLSIPDEEDEDDLDETTDSESEEKEPSPIEVSPNLSPGLVRPWSDFSLPATSIPSKKSPSRSYKYVQLQRALTSANLLQTNDDRLEFEQEYRQALSTNRFEDFFEKSYQKLRDQQEEIERKRALERSRTFMVADLEKNFLSRDPTRDIKVIFLDDPTPSIPSIFTVNRLSSDFRHSIQSRQPDDETVDAFYNDRARRLLRDPSRARDEITLFARRAGERLQERLPHLARVPHRVEIVDERETKGNIDKQTALHLKHRHALTVIEKRRQAVRTMITLAKKNQIRMERINRKTPLILTNTSCCRELLERAEQLEREQYKYSQMKFPSQRSSTKTTNYSSTQVTATNESLTFSFSSCSTPFQDALSIHHVEKINAVHVIHPKRPSTAPLRNLEWINYC